MDMAKVEEFFGLERLKHKNAVLCLQVFSITFLIFMSVLFLVCCGTVNDVDIQFSIWFHTTFDNVFFDEFGQFVNDHVHTAFWYNIGFILCIPKKTRKVGLLLLMSEMLTEMVFAGGLKSFVDRIRPYYFINLTNGSLPTSSSFPSGHTMVAFVAAMSIFLYNKKIGIFALIFAALVGAMRIYVFAHFFTDVFVGAVVGSGIAIVMYLVLTEAWVKFFDLDKEKPLENM